MRDIFFFINRTSLEEYVKIKRPKVILKYYNNIIFKPYNNNNENCFKVRSYCKDFSNYSTTFKLVQI